MLLIRPGRAASSHPPDTPTPFDQKPLTEATPENPKRVFCLGFFFAQREWSSVSATTHPSAKFSPLGKSTLTATEKSPGQATLPGLLQVVASACRLF